MPIESPIALSSRAAGPLAVALVEAAASGDAADVSRLLSLGVDAGNGIDRLAHVKPFSLSEDMMSPRLLGLTALMAAAGAGHEGCVDLLLGQSDIDQAAFILAKTPIQCEWSALSFAAMSRRPGMVAKLLKAGAHPRSGGAGGMVSPLMMAADGGCAECFGLILAVSAPGDRSASSFMSAHPMETCLSLAAGSGDLACCELALKGAAPEELGRLASGGTALHSAVKGGNPMVARLLMSACDPLALDDNGFSALMLAARAGDAAMARALLPASDVRARSTQATWMGPAGSDALMLAAQSEKDASGAIECLMAAGADPLARDEHGSTALARACQPSSMAGSAHVANVAALAACGGAGVGDDHGVFPAMRAVARGSAADMRAKLECLLPWTPKGAMDHSGKGLFDHARAGACPEEALEALGAFFAQRERDELGEWAAKPEGASRPSRSI